MLLRPLLALVALALPALSFAQSAGIPDGELVARIEAASAAHPLAVGIWPAEPFPGGLLVVDLAAAEELVSAEAQLRGKKLQWHALEGGGLRGMAPLRDSESPGRADLLIRARTRSGKRLQRKVQLRIQKVEFDSDELKVDSKFTKLPKKAVSKIAADRKALSAMWRKGSATSPHFRENFIVPREARQTAPYGTRRVFNGSTKSVHHGLDLDGSIGDPILAPNDGVVTMASDLYYSGGTLFLDHGGGLYTGYFHMDSMDVSVGDRVKKGQRIGTVGKSGRVTGPHLHWAAKIGGTYINPAALLGFDFTRPMVRAPEALVADGEKEDAEIVPAVAPAEAR